jgi:fumarate reductase subunit C
MSTREYRVPEPGYKDYNPPAPEIWWTKRRGYLLFMLREFTAIFVLLFTMRLLQGVIALSKGAPAWNAWVETASNSTFIAIGSLFAFFFVLFHSITWFQAGAVVTPLRIGKFQVPASLFVAGNMGLVVVVALVIGYFSIGG